MSFKTAKDVGFDLGPFSFKMSRPKSEQLRLHTLISDLALILLLLLLLVSCPLFFRTMGKMGMTTRGEPRIELAHSSIEPVTRKTFPPCCDRCSAEHTVACHDTR